MKLDEIWPACLNICEKELNKQQYSTWIKPLSGDINSVDKTLIISAPNQFVLQWVKERFNEKFLELLKGSRLSKLK